MGQVTIYAELNKRQYSKILSGEYGLEVPEGVTLKNRAGSRAIHFYCDSEKLASIMQDALDADGINYDVTKHGGNARDIFNSDDVDENN